MTAIQKNPWKTLLANSWFVVSSAFFYLFYYDASRIRNLSILAGIAASIVFAFFAGNMGRNLRKTHPAVLILSIIAALGITVEADNLRQIVSATGFVERLSATFNWSLSDTAEIFIVLFRILGLPFLTCLFAECYKWLWRNVLKDIRWDKKDLIIAGSIFLAVTIFMIFCYTRTSAFTIRENNEISNDVIYTSDTPVFLKGDVWVNLFHRENNHRQALFAPFAAPFFGPVYAIEKLIPAIEPVIPYLISMIHAALMLLAAWLLATVIERERIRRWLFVGLYFCLYSTLLFTVMIQQYQVSVFWLLILLYLCIRRKRESWLAWIASVGTITTSAILFPLANDIRLTKETRSQYIKRILFILAAGVLFYLLFLRLDIFLTFFEKTEGTTLGLTRDRLLQYLAFIPQCFIPPKASVRHPVYWWEEEQFSWLQDPVTSVSISGIVVLILCFIGLAVVLRNSEPADETNRNRRKLAIISAIWCVFSFLVLCLVGYGTNENGLTLYILYFGWSFFLLLYFLLDVVLKKIGKAEFIVKTAIIAALLIVNILGLWQITTALVSYYPPFIPEGHLPV